MIIRRTVPGETNKRLFLGVDAVVYVEGGKSLTRDEVEQGQFDIAAMDIQFLGAIVRCFWGKQKVRVPRNRIEIDPEKLGRRCA